MQWPRIVAQRPFAKAAVLPYAFLSKAAKYWVKHWVKR